MAELRVAIDALDEKLVALLARRQRYIERAAVLKGDRDTVRDPARVEDVIAKVLAAAKEAGLSADDRRAGVAHADRSQHRARVRSVRQEAPD